MLTAFVVAIASQLNTLSLERGGPGDLDFRYYAVSDTFIESTKAIENYGRDPLLSGGPGKTILIKFGDLKRIVGDRRVTRARIILTQQIGEEPQFGGAFRMVTRWGEGPGRRGLGLLETPIEAGAKAPNVSATWDSPLGGQKYSRWQAPGARGLADREEIKTASAVRNENQLIIDGLGPTIQTMVENPLSNHGFALDFRNPVDFGSSEALSGRPVLQIETEDADAPRKSNLQMINVSCSRDLRTTSPKEGEAVSWTAHFRYEGTQSGAIRVSWLIDGEELISEVPNGLSDGKEGSVTVTWPWRSKAADHRTRLVTVRAEMGPADSDRTDNAIQFYEAAIPVVVPDSGDKMAYVRAARFLNEVAFPFSRFSFALDGVRTGVRIQAFKGTGEDDEGTLRSAAREILLKAGVPDLDRSNVFAYHDADRSSVDPFPGITKGGDTRNDSAYPSILGFPAEPWFDSASAQLRFEDTNLLAATEVAALHYLMTQSTAPLAEQTPKTTVLRVLDSAGQLVKGARLEFYAKKGDKFEKVPSFTIDNNEGGICPVPNQGRTPFANFEDGVLMVRVSRGGTSATGFIKAWQLVDSFARGNKDAGILPLQVALPVTKPGDSNLAEGRIITDSFNSLPAKLDALTDGKIATFLDWPAGKAGWIELDLGKDRAIAKVELNFPGGAIWPMFKINIFGTGQKPEAARSWAQEISGPWMVANRGFDGWISYYGPLAQARYIMLEIPEGTPAATLAEWRVFGIE
ncbi:MAG: hypothetical protein JNK63_05255 [Chthonomonas sp.]|nr:hypothetical protein [Chthonomonas sp.]